MLAASFGYYLNPLANVLLGRFVLKEKLNRMQWTAVAIAGAGISVLAAGALGQLWISLTLCATFATYGLLRKIVAADAITGSASKPRSCFPVALLWLAWRHSMGVPVMGATADADRPAAACGNRVDDAALAVHRRVEAPALFDARNAPVHRPDAPVPDRHLYGEPLTDCALHRLPRDLDRAWPLRQCIAARAAAAATARMMLGKRRCSISPR